jgi:hypothetical protein
VPRKSNIRMMVCPWLEAAVAILSSFYRTI